MKRSVWKRVTAVCLAACLCALSLTACRTDEPKTDYTVTVQTQGGMPLAEIGVFVYADEAHTDLVWAGHTDDKGVTSFTATAGTYHTVLKDVPAWYTAQACYASAETQTVIALEASLQEGGITDHTVSLGDTMCDFTVTAGDASATSSTLAADYTLSELLKTKKAVVLNFWFENCGPCRAEFPYLETAYKQYAEDIEVLAINPYDGTAQSVMTYAANLGLTFPVVKGGEEWQSFLQLTSYPTTVVIDRYGMIAMIHKGAVTEVGVFEKVFAHFTADDYVQQTVRNLSDLG